ncbi:MAG: hypothetical protein ABSH29_27045 [Acidimicrobiales bacterium]
METCSPELRPCADRAGRWLAATPADYPYRIGVVGTTPEQAQQRFQAAMAAWAELHDRPTGS